MRYIILSFSLLCLLNSCSRYKYQYLELSSTDAPVLGPNRFMVENDTFRVVYDFRGEDGPLQISIVNKSKEAMQVDWTQSSMKIWNRTYSLFPRAKRKDSKDYDPAGEGLELIMPGSSIIKYCRTITRGRFIDKSGLKFNAEDITVGDHTRRIRRARIAQGNSPLSVRVLLSLKVAPTGNTVRILDHSFYISGLMATTIAPQKLPLKEHEHSIVLQRHTITGTTLVVAGVAFTAGIFLIAKQLEGVE